MFTENLANLLKEKGLTIRKLALELEIPTSSMDRYANGASKPDIEIVSKIANHLNVTTDYLIFGKSSSSFDNAEIELIEKYRACPVEIKQLVDNALNYEYNRTGIITEASDSEYVEVLRVARSSDKAPSGIVRMSKKELEELENAPKVLSDDEL